MPVKTSKEAIATEPVKTGSDVVKQAEPAKRKKVLVFPNAPIGNTNLAVWINRLDKDGQVLRDERTNNILQEEKAFQFTDGYYEIPSKMSEEEKLLIIKTLIEAGCREVDYNDPYFSNSKDIINESAQVIEYTLIHPERQELEAKAEYKLIYSDGPNPVEVKFLVLMGAIKTRNKDWAEMLQSKGFSLDSTHSIN